MTEAKSDGSVDELPAWCRCIFVKNTFLDVPDEEQEPEQGLQKSPLRRQRSAPAQLSSLRVSTEVSEQEDDPPYATKPLWVSLRRVALRGRRTVSSQRRRVGPRRAGRSVARSSGRSSQSSSRSSGRALSNTSSCSSSRRSCSSAVASDFLSTAPGAGGTRGQSTLATDGSSTVCRGTPPIKQWSELGPSTSSFQPDVSNLGTSSQEEDKAFQRLESVLPQPSKTVINSCYTDSKRQLGEYEIKVTNRFRALDRQLAEDSMFDLSPISDELPRVVERKRSTSRNSQAQQARVEPRRSASRIKANNPVRVAKKSKKSGTAKVQRGSAEISEMPCGAGSEGQEASSQPTLTETTDISSKPASSNSDLSTANAGPENSVKPLSDDKAALLARFTAQLSDVSLIRYMVAASTRTLLLAVPVDPTHPCNSDMLDAMVGMVIHCEAVDSSGWGFGTVIVPPSKAGNRGAFRCQGIKPLIAELQTTAAGTSLHYVDRTWDQVELERTSTTQERLRLKAMLARMKAARNAFQLSQKC